MSELAYGAFPGYAEGAVSHVNVAAGQSYEINPAVPLEPVDPVFGCPVLVRAHAGNAHFAILDTRWARDRIGEDFLLVQEAEDGQYARQTHGIRRDVPLRVGRDNGKGFNLDESVAREHFAIGYDEHGLVLTNLDIGTGTTVQTPNRGGRQVGRVIDTLADSPVAHYTPRKVYGCTPLKGYLGQLIGTTRELLDGEPDVGFGQGRVAVNAIKSKIAERGKNSNLPPAIEDHVSDLLLDNSELHGGDYQGRGLTKEALRLFGLKPKYVVKLDGANIYFSDTYEVNNRRAVIGYVHTMEDRVIARTFYLSNSQGLWRYLPSYIDTPTHRWYDKGHSQDSLNVPSEAQALLGVISTQEPKSVADPKLAFFGTARNLPDRDSGKTYQVEVRDIPLELDGNFHSGHADSITPPESVVFSSGEREPNFSAPLRSWSQESPLYGTIHMKAFPSNNNNYTYIMGSNAEGQSWVAGVESNSVPVMSTGLRSRWVAGGDLLMPLHEYVSESGGYGSGYVGNSYTSMWNKYLAHVPIIQQYVNRGQ